MKKNFRKIFLLFFVFSFIFVCSCNKKTDFIEWFDSIKTSGFLDSIKSVRSYGSSKLEKQDSLEFLTLDSIDLNFKNNQIEFKKVEIHNIDTLKIRRLISLLKNYKKEYFINSINIDENSLQLIMNLDHFDKNSLPEPRSDYYKQNELPMREGILMKILNDTLKVHPELDMSGMAKISENWYFYYIK